MGADIAEPLQAEGFPEQISDLMEMDASLLIEATGNLGLGAQKVEITQTRGAAGLTTQIPDLQIPAASL